MTDLSWANGLFVGSLSECEIRDFDALCQQGAAYRSYEGAGGFMGLAKVRFVGAIADTAEPQASPGRTT